VLKRYPIFLVTGFLTVTAAEVGHTTQQSSEIRLTAEVSATDIASGGAAAVVPGTPDSAGIDLNVGGNANLRYSFVAPGERIIGVQYRKLKFNRLKPQFLTLIAI